MRSAVINDVFNALDGEGRGGLTAGQINDALEQGGIPLNDPRIRRLREGLRGRPGEALIDADEFFELTAPCFTLLQRAVQQDFVIPRFREFEEQLGQVFDWVSGLRDGEVADYIPQLAKVDPEQFGVAICTIDGQRLSYGNADTEFCVQSTAKPVLYCAALEEHGEARVHEHIGREPSGRSFNELALNPANRPHNPMINAGAIMSASLIKPQAPMADRFDSLVEVLTELCGGARPGFNNAVYHSESETADRNFALAHYMREVGAFPEGVDIRKTLDLYFAACSMELTCEKMSVMAATFANSGVCPQTGRTVFSDATAKNALSMMYSCGMYDYSGEFAFRVGIPAKSGVSGAIMAVIPNVMGIVVWSPRLDMLGNSVRGVEFLKQLVERFNFHSYDSLVKSKKIDPRQRPHALESYSIYGAIQAASTGDIDELKRLLSIGLDLNCADYDGRTPLHLAAAEGRLEAVRFLLNKGVAVEPLDRWNNTPLDDARRHSQDLVAELLSQHARQKLESLSCETTWSMENVK